ncbi:hypothetical protein [Mesobacillus jeotgali]|uniref:hypothetical protein n=1 Tax=Mesobacillus jeotgali TaxID=129985 RepID=UPI000C83E1E7|nr:hypothetical protein [Mesobacillus jeotgali]
MGKRLVGVAVGVALVTASSTWVIAGNDGKGLPDMVMEQQIAINNLQAELEEANEKIASLEGQTGQNQDLSSFDERVNLIEDYLEEYHGVMPEYYISDQKALEIKQGVTSEINRVIESDEAFQGLTLESVNLDRNKYGNYTVRIELTGDIEVDNNIGWYLNIEEYIYLEDLNNKRLFYSINLNGNQIYEG